MPVFDYCKPMLEQTSNFFRLYLHISGKSNVPVDYHFWSAMSVLSASLGDRVWIEYLKGEKLKPNLYVGLIGPGSLGKGIAISQALRLLKDSNNPVHTYRGRLTYAHLIDRLGKPTIDEWGQKWIANPRLFLVMDELMNAVGSNKSLTNDFIALMTELYTATNYPLDTGTRMHGEVTINEPCLSWLFGSTIVWLRKVITKDIFESGFVARTCFILADYNLKKRSNRIVYPIDYDQVWEHLCCRLWALKDWEGPYVLSANAEAELDRWEQMRPCPRDGQLLSIWGRQKEMLLRFALLSCVADGFSRIIEHRHVVRAIHMTKSVFDFAQILVESANESYETKPINEFLAYIKDKKVVDRSSLLKWARARRGYDAAKLQKVVEHLRQEGWIKVELSVTNKTWYRYVEEPFSDNDQGSCS